MSETSGIEGLEAKLRALTLDSNSIHGEFQSVIEKIEKHLDSGMASHIELFSKYKELASECNQLKANSLPGNPYVLVLVDLHTHNFKDNIASAADHSGAIAAHRISHIIQQHLPNVIDDPLNCLITARIYGALQTFSVPEGSKDRSPATFAASFSRAKPLFDFTDTGTEAAVEDKIIGHFQVAVTDAQCKHIFVGAWRKPAYLAMLSPYRGTNKKVTIIQGHSMGSNFEDLDFPMITIPVFCLAKEPKSISGVSPAGGSLEVDHPSPVVLRLANKDNLPSTPARSVVSSPSHSTPVHNQNVKNNRTDPLNDLPTEHVLGFIPLNKKSERLDIYHPYPTKLEWATYWALFPNKKPCIYFHLGPRCTRVTCEFNHEPHNERSLQVIRYIARRVPCNEGGECRRLNCHHGHICQSERCVEAGMRIGGCNMPDSFHGIDMKVVNWVDPVRWSALAKGENERPATFPNKPATRVTKDATLPQGPPMSRNTPSITLSRDALDTPLAKATTAGGVQDVQWDGGPLIDLYDDPRYNW